MPPQDPTQPQQSAMPSEPVNTPSNVDPMAPSPEAAQPGQMPAPAVPEAPVEFSATPEQTTAPEVSMPDPIANDAPVDMPAEPTSAPVDSEPVSAFEPTADSQVPPEAVSTPEVEVTAPDMPTEQPTNDSASDEQVGPPPTVTVG